MPPPVYRVFLSFSLLLLLASGGLRLFDAPVSWYPLVALLLAGAVVVPFLVYDGPRFAVEGVVACRRCGYLRVGRHERRRDVRARDRAVSTLRWFLSLLLLVFIFSLGTGIFERLRGAGSRAVRGPLVGFGLPILLAVRLLAVYRPRSANPLRSTRRHVPAWETDWRRTRHRPVEGGSMGEGAAGSAGP